MKNAALAKRRVSFPFVLEELDSLRPTFKNLFGSTYVYLDDKLLFSLRDSVKHPGTNGIWIYTTAEHLESLAREFPELPRRQLWRSGNNCWVSYRRLKRKLSEGEKQEVGYFKCTSIVKEAWEVTLACAQALKARTILFQCPASFRQTKENISNLEKFFGNLNRQKDHGEQFNLCWEPRGNWACGDWDRKVVKRICDDLNLWHVVDPFTAESVTPHNLYFRLHGRNGWRYEYEEGELLQLAGMLPKHLAKSDRGPQAGSPLGMAETPYVFFNNAHMTQDALRFQTITEES